MNDNLKELMLEAGYAAPELAGRAKKLAELLIKECASIALREDHEPCGCILNHFGELN